MKSAAAHRLHRRPPPRPLSVGRKAPVMCRNRVESPGLVISTSGAANRQTAFQVFAAITVGHFAAAAAAFNEQLLCPLGNGSNQQLPVLAAASAHPIR